MNSNKLQSVTQSELVKLQSDGAFVVVGEYRFGVAESIPYVSKKDGKAAKFVKVTHTVEIGPKAVTVSEGQADNFDVLGYRSPIAKGTRVAVVFDRMQTQNGVCQLSGYCVPVVK